MTKFYTAEAVTEGHPDKLCDQIADIILDVCLKQDEQSRVTAGVYSTALSRTVQEMSGAGMNIEQIMSSIGLSRASVHSYLPYKKIPYNMDELSINAERIRLYRERKRRCAEFCANLDGMTTESRQAALRDLMKLTEG